MTTFDRIINLLLRLAVIAVSIAALAVAWHTLGWG